MVVEAQSTYSNQTDLVKKSVDDSSNENDDDEIWALLDGTAAQGDASSEEEPCTHRLEANPFVPGQGSAALTECGICRFNISGDAYEQLLTLAQSLLAGSIWSKILSTEPGEELELGEGWPLFRLHNSVGSDRLLWLYANDEQAMGPFDELGNAVASIISASSAGNLDLQLCAGSLVVLRDPGAKDSEVFAHRDWDDSRLPPKSAFTALVPLVLPDKSAGLEVFDTSGKLLGVTSYLLGEAIVFDNTLLHRTQPGKSPTRILASLSFAPTSSELWPAAERVLRSQTPFFYRSRHARS